MHDAKNHIAVDNTMSLNTFTMGLSFTDLPEFCGPDDLSDAIVSLRNAEKPEFFSTFFAPISDDGVRRLIKLAFFTSFVAEEGRYPQFRIINSDDTSEESIWRAANFNTPINDVESLRRIAPVASATDSALFITERDGALYCTGSMIVSDMGLGTKVGYPGIGGVGKSPSLILRVDGPGRIRISECHYTIMLDGGRMRQVVDYWLVPQVQALESELAAQMIDSIAQIQGEESRKYFGGFFTLGRLIHNAWSCVLASAIDRGHGGAFIVLPKTGSPEEFDIRCKYPAQMQFGDDIREFYLSCVKYAQSKDNGERERALHHWNWRRAAVFTKARILAGLSSVDGCVVVDRNLKVVGFGGEIRIDDEKLQTAPRTLRNKKTGEPMPEANIEQMGTRHRSAYRLAKMHPGIIAFVISQDGDLRIFCSDEHDVFGFDRLHAWVHDHESK